MKQISQDSEGKGSPLLRAAVRRQVQTRPMDSGLECGGFPPHSAVWQPLAVLVVLLALVLAPAARAATPFHDGFEGVASNSPLSSVSGWDASSATVSVQPSNAIPVAAGTNAVVIPIRQAATNLVAAVGPTVLWTDLQVDEASHMLPGITVDVDTNDIAQLYMDTNGFVVAWDRAAGQWLTYSNDVWGNAVSSSSAGAWARISLFKDYSTRKVALFLNGHLLRTELDFINTNRADYAGFDLDGSADNPVYLDEVWITNNVPPGLTSDVDQDGMADAHELQTYGNVTTWRRWTNTVSATVGGTVTPGAGTTTYSNGTVVIYTFSADSGFTIGTVRTNGVGAAYSGSATAGTFSWVITTDCTFAVVFAGNSTWSVPGDFPTLSAAVAGALSGNTIVASNGLTLSDSPVIDKTLTITGNNVTLNGTLTVNTGVTLTLSNAPTWTVSSVTLNAGAIGVLNNSSISIGTLAIGVGSYLRVTNGTVTVNGITMTGTFTLDSTFGTAVMTPSPLNFWDDFERYAVNLSMNGLGLFGWGASDASVVIQSNTTYQASARAALLPANTALTNTISAAGYSNVWTVCSVNESNGMVPGNVIDVDTNEVVMLCLTTNHLVMVYNRPASQWEVCSNDVWGASVTGLYHGGWAAIAVNQNYLTKKAAIFLNGHLVREQLDFIDVNQGSYVSCCVVGSEGGPTYLDSVGFSTNAPASLTNDLDHDGVRDAVEIVNNGSVFVFDLPVGAVFTIR